MSSVKGGVNMGALVVEVAIVAALLPVILIFVGDVSPNLSGAEQTLIGLLSLFIVMAVVFGVAKKAGIIGGKK